MGLPFHLPLSWEEFVKATEAGQPEDPESIRKNLQEMLTQVTDENLRRIVVDTIEKAGNSVVHLGKIQDRLRARLAG